MKDIAAQLAHRAQPNYIKQRAKEAAVEKSIELREKISGSPLALGIIGGLTTLAIARLVLSQRPRSYYLRNELGFEGEGASLKDKAQELKSQVSDKVESVKERAMDQVDRVRERIPSADEVKETAQRLTARARDYASEEPLVTALGALAIGAALGFLLPLTAQERRVFAPAREQIGAKLDELSSEVTEKVQTKVDDLQQKIAGEQDRDLPSGDVKFPH